MATDLKSEKAAPLPCVVLDANVLVANFRPSHAFKTLLDGARTQQIDIVIPHLVFKEAVNTYRDHVQRAQAGHEKAVAELARLGIPCEEFSSSHAMAETLKYQGRLRTTLQDAGCRFVPLPPVPHERLVQRALDRRKPFRDGDRGYRDALIWETVLLEARSSSVIFFCSQNTRDFAARRGSDTLADELLLDLKHADVAGTVVELAPSLSRLVERLVNVATVALDQVLQAQPNWEAALTERVRHLLTDYELPVAAASSLLVTRAELPLDDVAVDDIQPRAAQIVGVYDIAGGHIEAATLLSTNEVLAEMRVDFEVDLDVEVDLIGRDGLNDRYGTTESLTTVSRLAEVRVEATFAAPSHNLADLQLKGVFVFPGANDESV